MKTPELTAVRIAQIVGRVPTAEQVKATNEVLARYVAKLLRSTGAPSAPMGFYACRASLLRLLLGGATCEEQVARVAELMGEAIELARQHARTAGPIKAADLKVGRTYATKRPSAVGVFDSRLNDRQIEWISADGSLVQYDSPSVRVGRRLPKVTVESFLAWAHADVTELMPAPGEWRRAGA